MKFKEYSRQLSLSDINKEMLEAWDRDSLFEASMKVREGCPSFVFYEGPPSANGMPGIHHVMARTIKDIFCRYKTMKGFHVKRKAGWDTHGLPVELGVEKNLGITKEDIGKKISVDEYNAACRREVMKYTKEWTDLTHKMGYWVDLRDPYITYDNKYIESVWWLLRQLYDKGYLYKGYTIQPYSPAAGTGLSSHELNQPGCYRDVKDTTATVLFRIEEPKEEMKGWGDASFIAWTTTPWTLPSNTALCIGPRFKYVAVRTYNPYTARKATVVLAKDCMHTYFKPEGEKADIDAYKAGDKVLPWRIVAEYDASELIGMRYRQLMPWVKPLEKLSEISPDFVKKAADAHPEDIFTCGEDRFLEMSAEAFRIIPGDYVTVDDGTGIVHIAPTFGADDAKVAKAAGIPSLFMIDRKGDTRPMVDLRGRYYRLEDCAPEFVERCVDVPLYSRHEGDFVKNAYDPRFNPNGKFDETAAAKAEDLNIVLCIEMKQAGEAFRIEKHVHNYPHCWRTDKPVLYYPLDSWFIRTTAARQRLMELNETIKWKPASTGTGRFGKWLENLQDWNLSRSRYWGTPLPIWRTEDGKEEICIGSYAELSQAIDESVKAGYMKGNPLTEAGFVPGDMSRENYDRIDLHRPYVDDIVLVSPKTGRPMKRELDLIDVWFDSGSMPYAQLHYPFENRELVDNGIAYPADFIAEGVDQTRGWFFTLHAIATMVFDSVSFKAVISNGLVLDKNGNKMSKRLGNAIEPFGAIEKYGSDPLRWYMITNSSPWDNLKFDEDGVTEVSRTFFGKLYQTYSFFAMYANVDGFTGKEPSVPVNRRPEIDRWIISELNTLIKEVTTDFNEYEPTRAGRRISTFVIDNLSNWYVRLCRKRFWAGEMDEDKLSAHQTLWNCLFTISKLMAPIAPFYAERLYGDLAVAAQEASDSVHLSLFPICDETLVDKALEQRMELAQRITSMVLSIRKKEHVIVRQPLQKICIPVNDEARKTDISAMSSLVLNEVNVKEIEFVEGDMLEKKVKCNFRIMGKKFGKLMKPIAAEVANLSQEDIANLEKNGKFTLQVENQPVTIEREDVDIVSEDIPGWSVANDGALTVALDLSITPELRKEGWAREIVKRIQTFRKENGFDITDHINIVFDHHEEMENVVADFKDYICTQVLADNLTFDNVTGNCALNFEDFKLNVKIEKS